MLKTNWLLYYVLIIAFSLTSCKNEKQNIEKKKERKKVVDLIDIKQKGELRALVEYSSTSYFIYKGTPMGFEYELLTQFAKTIDVQLNIRPISDLNTIIDSLNDFKGDIIAANLTTTKQRKDLVEFTIPLFRTKQVLIQRKKTSDRDDYFIHHLDELIGKDVYVQKGSSFYSRLNNLSEEIGGDINVHEVKGNLTVEDLIESVSDGSIDYTVADQHVAKMNKIYYKNIDINVAISVEQQLAWAVRKNSPDLLLVLNDWLEKFKKTKKYRIIYLKYYGNSTLYKKRLNSDLFTVKSGQISPYDQLIKKYSTQINWDWRLLTSLIYQESQFNHYANSWVGAFGLMQIMPATAAEFNLDSLGTPEQNIEVGVKYLKWLDKQFKSKVENSKERVKFVLAAYNVGLGHVFDAIRLADKYYLDPSTWENNVAEMLLKKSNPKYYNDDVVHYGYCRGKEPYRYVNEILNRYDHYVNITELE